MSVTFTQWCLAACVVALIYVLANPARMSKILFVLADSARLSKTRARPMPAQNSAYTITDAAFAELLGDLAQANASAATCVLNQGKELNQRYLETMRRLDDKAGAILTLVGGGAGLVAVAAGAEKVPSPHITPLFATAVVCLIGVLFSAVKVQEPRRMASIDVEQLLRSNLLLSTSGEAKMTLMTAREYLIVAHSYFVVNRQKVKWYRYAQILFVCGVVSLVANALLTKAPQEGVGTVQCKLTDGKVFCGAVRTPSASQPATTNNKYR